MIWSGWDVVKGGALLVVLVGVLWILAKADKDVHSSGAD